MAKLPIANTNLVLNATSGTANVTGIPNTKVKASGANIYTDPLSITVTGASQGNCQGASGSGVISATSTKTKATGSFVMRQTDNATITVNGLTVPGGAPCSFPVTVTIANAGQNKVNSE